MQEPTKPNWRDAVALSRYYHWIALFALTLVVIGAPFGLWVSGLPTAMVITCAGIVLISLAASLVD